MKASVVAADPLERNGLRSTMNLGHTLAHATGIGRRAYELLHGEAVAVGIVFAGAVGVSLCARADRRDEPSHTPQVRTPRSISKLPGTGRPGGVAGSMAVTRVGRRPSP